MRCSSSYGRGTLPKIIDIGHERSGKGITGIKETQEGYLASPAPDELREPRAEP